MNVLLELANGFGREGMADDLTLPRMFCTVTDIEKPATDRYESIIVFAVIVSRVAEGVRQDSRLQEAIAVTIDDLNGIRVRD